VRRIVDSARAQGRPVLAGIMLPPATRRAAGPDWRLHGPWWRLDDAAAGADSVRTVALAARLAAGQVGPGDPLPDTPDAAARTLRRVLSCAALLARRDEAARALLATRCNRR
jgi:hypothetical protein